MLQRNKTIASHGDTLILFLSCLVEVISTCKLAGHVRISSIFPMKQVWGANLVKLEYNLFNEIIQIKHQSSSKVVVVVEHQSSITHSMYEIFFKKVEPILGRSFC